MIMGGPKNITAPDRIRRRCVVTPTGCWCWTGGHYGNGYAAVYDPRTRRNGLGHRLAFEAFIGPIPDGLEIDHLCRVRDCLNPAHLRAVTHRVNVLAASDTAAAISASRSACPRGHPYSGRNVRGDRTCRVCLAAAEKRRRERLRAAA